MRPSGGNEGFSVLETLVGFLILSIALAVFTQTVSTAARSITIATERSMVIALLNELQSGDTPRLKQSISFASGKSRDLNWVIEKRRITDVSGLDNPASFYVTIITTKSDREYRFLNFVMPWK